MYELIERINEAADVKKFKAEELDQLAVEIREALFNRLTKIGGHFGPNFGMVEAEIAMHYVFNSPVDQFVFDVSHQSYPHKILTGRKAGYIYDDHFFEDSGYTNPGESEHDLFNVGHTSTSISLASGLVKARDLKGEKRNVIAVIGDGATYTSMTAAYIMDKAKKDKDFLVITPAMPMTGGLSEDLRKELGSQYIDVGIAEEQAVAMASGAARNGAKPLVITNTTFIQRTYDQISQDICINGNAVTILLNYTSFAGLTDVTHLGIFGISAFSSIPNLQILAPSSKSEYLNMLDWALDQNEHPVMILIPGNEVTDREADKDYSNIGRFKVEHPGEKAAILALGDFYQMGESLAEAVKENLGFEPTLINPRFASTIDTELLEQLKENHKLVVTLEDGILDGGFGQKIAAYYSTSDVKVKNYGLEKKFYDRYDPAALLKELGMTNEAMVEDIRKLL